MNSISSPAKNWLRIALLNFFAAAILGLLLRLAFVVELPWIDYRNILHGHSHVAMLGWLFLAIYALLINYFLPSEKQQSKFYKRLFWLIEATVIGMFVAFPLQGYAGFSILFSSSHIILSYVFMWRFLKDARPVGQGSVSFRFVKSALWLMVLSTIAIWSLPVIMAMDLRGSALYYAAVQFYLHFQFNGWFIFAILGLFFKLMENGNVALPSKKVATFFYLLTVSCLLTYALAVTWSTPLPFLFWLNSAGVAIQFAALIYFLLIFKDLRAYLFSKYKGWVGKLLYLSLICFVIKIIIQTAVIIPQIATVAYTIRNFVLGFIHLLLLGLVTCFALGLAADSKLIDLKNKAAIVGLVLLLAGIILTELFLFAQGTLLWAAIGFIPGYYELIFAASVLIPIGVLMLAIPQFKTSS